MIRSDALRRRERRQALLTVVFTIISVLYLMPVFLVLINSLKANAFVNTETFKLPTAESFVGLKNYVKGMTFGNFAFYKVVFYSFFITITSTALILVCTSMAAWYISRVGSLVSKIVYYLCRRIRPPQGHLGMRALQMLSIRTWHLSNAMIRNM